MEIYERFDCCHAAVNTAMLYVTTVNCSCSRKSQSNHYIVQLLFNSDSIKPLDSFVFRMSCMETFFFFLHFKTRLYLFQLFRRIQQHWKTPEIIRRLWIFNWLFISMRVNCSFTVQCYRNTLRRLSSTSVCFFHYLLTFCRSVTFCFHCDIQGTYWSVLSTMFSVTATCM